MSENQGFLVMNNISKKNNFGTLLRSATAFGIKDVLIVGSEALQTFGHQGTLNHSTMTRFKSLPELKEYLKQNDIALCGIEIHPDAKPIHTHPFRPGKNAFLFGNEGIGMSPQQIEACDYFVYIPQYSGTTASLNVSCAGSIVFHHYALHSQYSEQQREGYKFVVEQPRSKLDQYLDPTPQELEIIQQKKRLRALKKEQQENEKEEEEEEEH